MIIKVNDEFIKICEEILSYNRTELEWADYESCDMFQSENYCGGFEEVEFTFSYYEGENEYWFQLSLDDIKAIKNGKITEINARIPD